MALSPAPTIAQRLIYALHELHRPELVIGSSIAVLSSVTKFCS